MHEGRAGLLDVDRGSLERVLDPGPDHHRLGAVVLARLDLRHRRVLRDEDAGPDAGGARGPADGLAVVAGACRDDARSPLALAQRADLVHGAAHLEGPGSLEVLGLEQHRTAGEPREGLGRVDRGDPRDTVDPAPGLLDVSVCGTRLRLQRETPSP